MAFYKNFTMATIVFTDGTSGTALTHTCDADKGTLQIGDIVPGLRSAADYERKGQWVSSAFTNRRYPSFSLTFNMAKWKDTSTATVTDFILGTSGTSYATRKSTILPSGGTSGKVPFACDISITIEGTNYGDSADHAAVLTDVRIDSYAFAEGDPNEITVTGVVLGAITGDLAQAVAT